MTRPEAIKLGPFTGGLNLAADPQNIDNSELQECINFEVDLDGSLMSRPAIIETVSNASNSSIRMKIIGRARVSGGGSVLLGCNGTAVYYFGGAPQTWTYIANVNSEVALQYNDTVYIIATVDSSNPGGRWNGFSTFTADATMPRGSAAVFHKSRLFVVPGVASRGYSNSSRLTFSDTITSTVLTWTATNIIDVSPGDGETLNDIIVYNDNLLLFKDNSIYLLAYDIAPANAVLRQVNGGVGVSDQQCVDFYENSIFFLHKGNVWEMLNFEFKQINQNVPFVYDTDISANAGWFEDASWLRRMGNRILVGFYKKRYAFNLLTRTWSEWQVDTESLQLFGPPMAFEESVTTNEPVKYYMGSTGGDYTSFFYITDKYVEGSQDYISYLDGGLGPFTDTPIQCSMRTKSLDFDIPFVWKRLMWWGMHATTGTAVQGIATINNFNQTNDTWENIGNFKWNELPGTWDNVLNNFSVPDDVTAVAEAGGSFYKFQKSMRFRNISFKIIIQNDGNTAGGPSRLFTLTASVGYKQVVAKDAN